MPHPYDYVHQEYPKWIKDADGKDRVAVDSKEHSAMVGYEVGPDGKPVEQKKK